MNNQSSGAFSEQEINKKYIDLNIIRSKMRWNILVNALKSGRKAMFDQMDVLSASMDEIIVGCHITGREYFKFLRSDIFRQGKMQIDHFNITYFFENGIEIK